MFLCKKKKNKKSLMDRQTFSKLEIKLQAEKKNHL